MSRAKDIIAVLSGLVLLLSYFTVHFTTNTSFLYVSSIVSNLWIEILLLIVLLVLSKFWRKESRRLLAKKLLLNYKLLETRSRNFVLILLTFILIGSLINFYFLGRARVYFYQNTVFNASWVKVQELKKAISFENEGKFDRAIEKYESYVVLSPESDNTFLTDKIQTLQSRIDYAQDFYAQAKAIKIEERMNQRRLSLYILSLKMFPGNESIRQKVATEMKVVVSKIDSIFTDNVLRRDKESLIKTLLGKSLMSELSRGDYGSIRSVSTAEIQILIKSQDDEFWESYIKESWRYHDCIHFLELLNS